MKRLETPKELREALDSLTEREALGTLGDEVQRLAGRDPALLTRLECWRTQVMSRLLNVPPGVWNEDDARRARGMLNRIHELLETGGDEAAWGLAVMGVRRKDTEGALQRLRKAGSLKPDGKNGGKAGGTPGMMSETRGGMTAAEDEPLDDETRRALAEIAALAAGGSSGKKGKAAAISGGLSG